MTIYGAEFFNNCTYECQLLLLLNAVLYSVLLKSICSTDLVRDFLLKKRTIFPNKERNTV